MQAVVKHWHSGIYLADENPNMYHQRFFIEDEEGGTIDTQFNDLIQGAFRIQPAVCGELLWLNR